MVSVWWDVRMWYPFPAGQISLKAAVARVRGKEVNAFWTGTYTALSPICCRLTGAISRAALAPRTPGLADTAATELTGEACGQWVLTLVLRTHQAETQALLLWLVCCRGQWQAWASGPEHCPCPSFQQLQTLLFLPRQPLILMWPLTPYDPEFM